MTGSGKSASVLFYGLTATAVWLGWEVVKVPISDRAPPATAVRVAPSSPEVLRRAAEAELAGGRTENARVLATESLVKAPFNARALRVLGLAEARAGREDQADALLTLAGNWSLRDDPAHGWLIERRLRQGNYSSAFAHADTLARRWVDGNERVYNLFATAALTDPRALPALAVAIKRRPSWRPAFIDYLIRRPDADALLLGLGLVMADHPDGYTDTELSWIYQKWYEENRFQAIRLLRSKLRRPDRPNDLQNGDFSTPIDAGLMPFGWRLDPISGASSALIEDDQRNDEIALRVEYDGYANGVLTTQVLMLAPGGHALIGDQRLEVSPETSRLRWRVTCVESRRVLGHASVPPAGPETTGWRPFRLSFQVPATACTVQDVRLETNSGDRRATVIAWFDKLRFVSAPAAPTT